VLFYHAGMTGVTPLSRFVWCVSIVLPCQMGWRDLNVQILKISFRTVYFLIKNFKKKRSTTELLKRIIRSILQEVYKLF
jgi:predicted metal-binding transcription factor (methanogenesis marker protein 9)